MKLPSNVSKVILEGLCLIIYPNPLEKRKNPTTNLIEVDWWAASIKVITFLEIKNDPTFNIFITKNRY